MERLTGGSCASSAQPSRFGLGIGTLGVGTVIGQSATSRFAENNPLDAIDRGALVSLALASRGRGVLRSSVRPGRRYDQAARGVKPVVLVLGERA